MKPAIAIVGMACRYPDAQSPAELWQNVLTQRRAFRRIPDERLRLDDYYSADPDAGDNIYITQTAVLKNYEFDRVKHRVAGATFRQSDLAHWLALDVAAQALDDAGFTDGEGLTSETTGVILGNTLTGEFSRANLMRLRWPYVRRVVAAALVEQRWGVEQRDNFLHDLEAQYKAPFPPIGEETLAGGLSNTIAGRICNHFDLKGGGYTVDGACASSMLAAATACSSLAAGDLDLALAGGVDLSLDPFELVGFARTNALAPDVMRVYDRRSAGFWPGEGCGFVVLMRAEDALAQQRRIYALIRGWGVSSDGSGGITRPEVDGQVLAVKRAYQRAGFGIETVAYFEGHGTGTAVGDATELRTITQALRAAGAEGPAAVIGSVKANIGHTKAAAGVAGLIKATLALHHQLLPPNTGNEEPHPELTGEKPALRVLAEGEPWPVDRPLRAGVSAMGFGGINTHLVLEANGQRRRRKGIDTRERRLLVTPQDAELFLLAGHTTADLQQQVSQLLAYAGKLALAELTDLAAELARRLRAQRAPASGRNTLRAAIVASTPAELVTRLEALRHWLEEGITERLDVSRGLFLGSQTQGAPRTGRIGFLFPGQGARVDLDGGVWQRRFATVAERYAAANLSQYGYRGVETAVAQPAIITAALAGLRVLDELGIDAAIAVGHSLGELAALCWAGAIDEEALLRVATVRGKAMMGLGSPTGTMAAIGAGQAVVRSFLNGEAVTIACFNTPAQTVIAGDAAQVATIVARAQGRGVEARSIAVSHAFHSPLVAAAAQPLAAHLVTEQWHPLQQTVISTVTGAALPPAADLIDLLQRQVTEPVRFSEAVTAAATAVDLFIEVGPGRTLTGLAGEFLDIPTIALDVGGSSFKGLLRAVGAAFVLGANVRHEALFADRFSRPFGLNWQASFLVNPCELAPLPEGHSDKVTRWQGDKVTTSSSDAVVGSSGHPVTLSSLGPQDVLLVTGGGKGITAECALSLAQATGAKLALFGRSQPQADEALAANLNRMLAAGVSFHYYAVDVTDAAAVQAAVRRVEATLGRVTVILHGAARNAPQALRNLTEADFQRTLAPKLHGMRNLLAALDPSQLRLVISFGSIIARLGLPGEADYGLANEWLAQLTASLQEVFPQCRCLTIDWSVWAGSGMGERLGALEGLMRQGIAPIPLEAGVGMLHRLLEQVTPLPSSVIVAGRYGQPTTIGAEAPALPFWRFLEQVRVHYPGVELVVDATLSGETDPYLADHVYQGERLFLAVLGLEAMAQTAMALTGSSTPPVFTDVQFLRPIVVPEGAQVTIRLAALRRETGEVEVVLRSAENNFQVDHFRAVCRFDRQHGTQRVPASGPGCSDGALLQFPALRLDPKTELYEKLFFHKGRFRRVQSYRQVTAREMLAELSPEDSEPWFGRILPPDLVLGDPGARDATIHAIQVCVPGGTLLPIGVERIVPGIGSDGGPRFVHARERTAAATADTLVFDVAVLNGEGCILEQ
jgi:acyl transferase domain-containing protein